MRTAARHRDIVSKRGIGVNIRISGKASDRYELCLFQRGGNCNSAFQTLPLSFGRRDCGERLD